MNQPDLISQIDPQRPFLSLEYKISSKTALFYKEVLNEINTSLSKSFQESQVISAQESQKILNNIENVFDNLIKELNQLRTTVMSRFLTLACAKPFEELDLLKREISFGCKKVCKEPNNQRAIKELNSIAKYAKRIMDTKVPNSEDLVKSIDSFLGSIKVQTTSFDQHCLNACLKGPELWQCISNKDPIEIKYNETELFSANVFLEKGQIIPVGKTKIGCFYDFRRKIWLYDLKTGKILSHQKIVNICRTFAKLTEIEYSKKANLIILQDVSHNIVLLRPTASGLKRISVYPCKTVRDTFVGPRFCLLEEFGVLAVCERNTIKIIELHSLRCIQEKTFESRVDDIAFSTKINFLAVCLGEENGGILVFSLDKAGKLLHLEHRIASKSGIQNKIYFEDNILVVHKKFSDSNVFLIHEINGPANEHWKWHYEDGRVSNLIILPKQKKIFFSWVGFSLQKTITYNWQHQICTEKENELLILGKEDYLLCQKALKKSPFQEFLQIEDWKVISLSAKI